MNRAERWVKVLEIAYGGGPVKGPVWYDADEEAKIDAGLAENPRDHSLLTAKGVLNFNHKPAVSIEAFSRAIAIKPLDAHQHSNRGRKYVTLGQYAEGIADLETAAQLDPENNWTWFYLGCAYFMELQFADAARAFDAGLAASLRNNHDLISGTGEWLWNARMHLGERDAAAAAVADITPEYPAKDDLVQRNTCMLLNGRMPVEDYIALIDAESVYGNPDGKMQPSVGYYNVARYYRYGQQDLDNAVKYLRIANSGPIAAGWEKRLLAIDGPVWEAEYAAAGQA